MTAEMQWAIEHISWDGVSAGVMQYDDEESARTHHALCRQDGRPCHLLARELPKWSGVVS